MIKETGDMLKR